MIPTLISGSWLWSAVNSVIYQKKRKGMARKEGTSCPHLRQSIVLFIKTFLKSCFMSACVDWPLGHWGAWLKVLTSICAIVGSIRPEWNRAPFGHPFYGYCNLVSLVVDLQRKGPNKSFSLHFKTFKAYNFVEVIGLFADPLISTKIKPKIMKTKWKYFKNIPMIFNVSAVEKC